MRNKSSMLGANYPDTPSNITTAAIINNREEGKVTPEKVKAMGVDDLVALNTEVFSISLVLCAYMNGELDVIDLPRNDSIAAMTALKMISENGTKTDEEFLAVFEQAIRVWPQIIETDYHYTDKAVKQARKQASEQGNNVEMATITTSMMQNHVIDTLEASELMNSMLHYAFGISKVAETAFGENLK